MYRYNILYGKKDTFISNLHFLEAGKYLTYKNKKLSLLKYNNFKIKINNNVSYEDSKKHTYKIIKENFYRQRKNLIINLYWL